MSNNIVRFRCPHCQQVLGFERPAKGNMVQMVCPKCHKPIRIKLQDRPVQTLARLVTVSSPCVERQSYSLHLGSNIIGRSDTGTAQDISIAGDATISRQSVDLTVQVRDGRCTYQMRVLNAKNPVFLGKKALSIGDVADVAIGSVITLGATQLMLYKQS